MTIDKITKVTLFSWDGFGTEQHLIYADGEVKGMQIGEIRELTNGVAITSKDGNKMLVYKNMPMIIEYEITEAAKAKDSIY